MSIQPDQLPQRAARREGSYAWVYRPDGHALIEGNADQVRLWALRIIEQLRHDGTPSVDTSQERT